VTNAQNILGAIGTVVLFFNSYALQPFQGDIFGGDALTASNDAIRTANAKRVVRSADRPRIPLCELRYSDYRCLSLTAAEWENKFQITVPKDVL